MRTAWNDAWLRVHGKALNGSHLREVNFSYDVVPREASAETGERNAVTSSVVHREGKRECDVVFDPNIELGAAEW